MLPGSPTSGDWKVVPASEPITNEDENGVATSTVLAAYVGCVRVYDDSDGDVAVVRALV